MARHVATVAWANDGQFEGGRYSRAHEWRFDGGAVVRASSSPYVVPVPLSDPTGVDPEEALIASASSCHMLWFLSLAQEKGIVISRYVDEAKGEMRRDERGRMALTKITLSPTIEFEGVTPSSEELDRLHHEAHEKCFIANSLRSEIVVEMPPSRDEDQASTRPS
jgi:organic hydroperoxide reductase OsmC/OhrA